MSAAVTQVRKKTCLRHIPWPESNMRFSSQGGPCYIVRHARLNETRNLGVADEQEIQPHQTK